VLIRSVLVLAALTAAIVYGLMSFTRSGNSPNPNVTTTNAILPGGWPSDSNQVRP
jgi:hypothetical protein